LRKSLVMDHLHKKHSASVRCLQAQCKRGFATSQQAAVHHRLHSGRLSILLHAFTTKHCFVSLGAHTCFECGAIHRSLTSLWQHQIQLHGRTKQSFQCHLCLFQTHDTHDFIIHKADCHP
jgi:galactose mutarotase-like enzyme